LNRKPILPIAVFSYNDKRTVPEQFTIDVPTLRALTFDYYQIHLVKKNWREFIQKDNPVAAALLSKMNYTEEERVQVKLEFLRMISRMELNPAEMKLIYGFFDTYLKLNEKEEKQMREEIKNLPDEEREDVLYLPNSYMDKGIEIGKERGKQEGKLEGKKEVAKNLLSEGMAISKIADVTGLSEEDIEKLASDRN